MTDHDRSIIRMRGVYLLRVLGLSTAVLVAGCGGFRQMVGLDRTTPDEFAVESRAPLTIPPEFDLRPPAPGAARPQEQTAADRARRAMESAGPGDPSKQAGAGQAGGGRLPQVRDQQQPDPTQQMGDTSLSRKLLGTGDTDTGAAVEKRETTPLKGVY